MNVYAFDRDSTVDVNPPNGRDAVPLAWVTYLDRETDHEVWAIGNQALVEEADIPGDETALERYEREWGDPVEQIEQRGEPNFEEQVEDGTHAPDPDLVTALAEWKTDDTRPARHQRVRLVGTLFPDADRRIVVDNRHLDYIEGWTHYLPWEFVREVEEYGEMATLES